MTLTIHHLRQSQSDRIIWLCEELDVPYALESYEREPNMAAPPEYRALSMFGTAPVITDDSLTLGESGAIVEYICAKHGGGQLAVGPDSTGYADYLFWFHFANGSLVPALMVDHISRAGGLPPAPSPNRIERALAAVEQHLATRPYFAGDVFTAADIMMALPRFADQLDLSALPHTRAYLERVSARPAWRRTEELR